MNGMAEVMLEHRVTRIGYCSCGAFLPVPSPSKIADHIEGALTSAGFGRIAEARAEALEEAAGDFERRSKNTRNNVSVESGAAFYTKMMEIANGLERSAESLRARATEMRAAS